ncbi:MAG: cytochrome-c peroxidase, partial [Pirellulaceae bacterium]
MNQPKNHAVFEPELPANLAAGRDSVYVPSDNPMTRAKVELGRQLYFDKRLSVDATVSCADCHHPDHGYGFDTQFGVGVRGQTGNRNSPVSFN